MMMCLVRALVGIAVLMGTSGAVQAQPAADPLTAAVRDRYDGWLGRSRYMVQTCVPVARQGWPGIPLQQCRYSALGATAVVTLALPDAVQLARWTVTACRDARSRDLSRCTQYLERRIRTASGAQFPVGGFVIEPRSVLGGSSSAPLCFLFRNGVTIRTASVATQSPVNGRCVPADPDGEPASIAFRYARIASTTRGEYAAFVGGGAGAAAAGLGFLDVIRLETVAAWSSTRNRLLSASAAAAVASGEIQ